MCRTQVHNKQAQSRTNFLPPIYLSLSLSLCLSLFLSPDLLMCLLALPPSILSNHVFASFLIMQLLSRTQANNKYFLIVSGALDKLMRLGFPNIETGALQLTAPQDSKYCLWGLQVITHFLLPAPNPFCALQVSDMFTKQRMCVKWMDSNPSSPCLFWHFWTLWVEACRLKRRSCAPSPGFQTCCNACGWPETS